MSPTDPPSTDRRARTAFDLESTSLDRIGAVASYLFSPVRATAFWTAVLLPLTYVPLLASGLLADRPTTFVALTVLNAVAFVLGHPHKRSA
jgi:hypothetical protein